MNTTKEMRERVRLITKGLVDDLGYGILDSKAMAIGRVRCELEAALEVDMNNPYGDGPIWAAARLTLFNSMYR